MAKSALFQCNSALPICTKVSSARCKFHLCNYGSRLGCGAILELERNEVVAMALEAVMIPPRPNTAVFHRNQDLCRSFCMHLQDQKQKQNYSALLQNYSALLQVLREDIGTAISPKNNRILLHTRIHLGSHMGSHWVHKLYGGSKLL